MSTLMYRIGRWSATHPWRVITAWIAVLVACFGLAAALGGSLHDNYDVPGIASTRAQHSLEAAFPESAGAGARVVVHDIHGQTIPARQLESLGSRLTHVDHVVAVAPPRVSPDGDTAILALTYDVPVTSFEGTAAVDQLDQASALTRESGLQVELGGEVPENLVAPGGTAELIGVVAALAILFFAFGSIVAAGLPIAVAVVGLGAGMSLVTVLAGFTDVSTSAPTVAVMVGLGVGIDYALLLVTRYVEGLRAGLDVPTAAGEAIRRGGVSVVFAGFTVLVSLLGLRFAGLPVYASFGYATGLTVLAVMLASLTLVPALCGLLGLRVLNRAARRELAEITANRAAAVAGAAAPIPVEQKYSRTAAWARVVGRRPLVWALLAFSLLLMLAAPALGMRTWPQDAGTQPEHTTTREAYDLTAAAFGPGANGPLLLSVDLAGLDGTAAQAKLAKVTDAARAVDGVATVAPAVLNRDGSYAVISVEATTSPQDEATARLLDRLRAEGTLPPGTQIAGVTPTFADISALLSDRLPVVVAAVVAASVVLMTLLFRSIVVPIKAAIMNLLSVAAAYGVMTVVFQWGWGAEALGLPHAVPVSSWVPILMFAVLFGLSMDYEVFLLSRIREDWLATGESRGSVTRGLAVTGPVITSAAAIMICVFLGFALDGNVVIKMIGVGMATAVLIDATLVRMVLVPSTMALLGSANWYLPAWLDRILPHLHVEGESQEPARPHHSPSDERELVGA
jgi:RND superfamily putative drug exporter